MRGAGAVGGPGWAGWAEALARAPAVRLTGRLTRLDGLAMEAALGGVRLGELCRVAAPGGPLLCEVVALRPESAVLLPLGEAAGVALGAEVVPAGRPLEIGVGEGLLGRVLDGLGRPLDGPPPPGLRPWPVERRPPPALARPAIAAPLPVGVRAVDGLCTLGRGQRIGLFAGAGVGKSSLLGRLARQAEVDVRVVCLVGERGREVRPFLEEALGPEGRARSVVVVATSDEPPLVRLRAAQVASAVAEWFAAEGREVLMVVDSLTRFARAQRDVGLAAGEPPARQGYPASVFQALPRLVERAGPQPRGCITALYAVLVAGHDQDEPIADELRGLLDGHLVLERRLAERGHFPAIDPLASVSRLMEAVAAPAHRAAARRVRALASTWEQQRDLVAMGAWKRGADPAVDEALDRWPAIEAFLCPGGGGDAVRGGGGQAGGAGGLTGAAGEARARGGRAMARGGDGPRGPERGDGRLRTLAALARLRGLELRSARLGLGAALAAVRAAEAEATAAASRVLDRRAGLAHLAAGLEAAGDAASLGGRAAAAAAEVERLEGARWRERRWPGRGSSPCASRRWPPGAARHEPGWPRWRRSRGPRPGARRSGAPAAPAPRPRGREGDGSALGAELDRGVPLGALDAELLRPEIGRRRLPVLREGGERQHELVARLAVGAGAHRPLLRPPGAVEDEHHVGPVVAAVVLHQDLGAHHPVELQAGQGAEAVPRTGGLAGDPDAEERQHDPGADDADPHLEGPIGAAEALGQPVRCVLGGSGEAGGGGDGIGAGRRRHGPQRVAPGAARGQGCSEAAMGVRGPPRGGAAPPDEVECAVTSPFQIAPEVAAALAERRPVVALESSVVAQGLPPPENLEAARRCAAAVRAGGAVPATVAVLGGRVVVGASPAELERLANPGAAPAKASARDLAPLCAAGRDAGTTVSATAFVAARVGIRLFATGGIGGVHRRPAGEAGAPLDVSADLGELARLPVCVVSAGPKAILDLAATAEALETLGVTVVGFGTSELPAFYAAESGLPLAHRVEDAAGAAAVLRQQWEVLGRSAGVLLCVPPPDPLPRAEVEAAVAAGLEAAARRGITGPAVTPFLLDAVSRATAGRSRVSNLALLERNARVAAEVAVASSLPG